MSFVERHGLWSDEQAAAAREVERRLADGSIETVRFSFPDQHGVLRGKTLVAGEAAKAMRTGVGVTTSLLAKDTAHKTVFPVWTAGGGFGLPEMQGAADALMIADPTTFRVLPWAPGTGWLLCDIVFCDGRRIPFATRDILRRAVERLREHGYDFVAGLEVECHIFKLVDAKTKLTDSGQPGQPPEVELLTHGYQYLTEQRFDQLEPALDLIRRNLVALGLPLRSIECEYGPSQAEFTFQTVDGLAAADLMVLFRSAVKQIARRNGYHATFMCRPNIPNVMSSGWHLHQSLRDRTSGANAFVGEGDALLSPLARKYLGGLLQHARAASLFTTPTINGYRRYQPYSLAPDRAVWGRDNRGVMIRMLGGPGDPATRLENRVGEPAANPYLYMASQVLAGLDGIERGLDPGLPADAPYDTRATMLPKTIREAIDALRADDFFRQALGSTFVEYYTRIKEAELVRFQAEVTRWEQAEYFDIF